MFGKQLLLATVTVIAATAGQVTISKSLAAGVRIDGGTGLTCSNVLCEAMAGRSFTFTSLMSGGSSVAASLGLPGESYVQMMSLSGLNLSSAQAMFTPADDASDAEEAGSFEISNGKITQIDTDDSSDPKRKGVPSLEFFDPIVSMSFNANSTSIASDVVTSPAPSLSLTIVGPGSNSAAASAAADSTTDAPLAITLSATVTNKMGSMSTPEPGTEMLIGIGLIAAGAFARVKRNASSKS